MAVEYKIIDTVAVLSDKGTWNLELNIVKWGDHAAKFDIRTWNEDHTKCGKGITLTDEEAEILITALQKKLE